MASSLREDEKFVIESLCATYGGTWRIGEDPPDAYLSLPELGNEIAVEISMKEIIDYLSLEKDVITLCKKCAFSVDYFRIWYHKHNG